MNRTNFVRFSILIATAVGAWGLLSLGDSDRSGLAPGQVATRNYVAQMRAEVVDEEATERARVEAVSEVPDQLTRDVGSEEAGMAAIEEIMAAAAAGVVDHTALEPRLHQPDQIATTTAAASTTEGTAATTYAVAGQIYLDSDVDGVFSAESVDRGLGRISVLVYDENGTEIGRGESQSNGTWQVQVSLLPMFVAVDGSDPEFPEALTLSSSNDLQSIECEDGNCVSVPVGYRPAVRTADVQVSELRELDANLNLETVETLVAYATGDVVRTAVGEQSWLAAINASAQQELNDVFRDRVTSENLGEIRNDIIANPPLVLIGASPDPRAQSAAADIVSSAVRANYVFDPDATERERQEARAGVEDITETILANETIASEGDRLDRFMIDAILATRAASLAETGQSAGLLAVLAAMVASIGFYLARFRQEFWNRPRMAALLGLLVVLGAGGVRLTIEAQAGLNEVAGWYLLPTVIFGLMTTVLFDSRVAAVMALAMSVLVAAGTRDPGLAAYAAMSTMVPVGFVSSLSTQGAYRRAVLASAAAVALIAATVAWFFHTTPDQSAWETVAGAGALAAGISVLTALLGLAGLQLFENAFDITTNLRLLELTDRNHAALVRLQEEAFGTFNHSLMVGTLADAAARAVGANALLARAAAYYHDLGKTTNPAYFIENQFGASNPHDDLEPRQSVALIRRHVTDGVDLARKFKIPTEVAEAIVTHHGDGIMRFFYEKARRAEGDEAVDPADFRHVGHKPRSSEMAIVMLADSLEAACRAVFQEEEPTPEAIEKVVNRVVDEKVNDGQLTECTLTLAQLTRTRRAFLEALIGHYHQRIQYPNFPGS
ncbi:MAG TPA: HDIG domain-containing protein [Acidimicrobiia bacterium]|nr:HDIG domain-containing protein [Acidimicrobiia bacterium]